MNNIMPFHLAFPVLNLDEAIDFYTKILGCKIGRSTDKWVDFNFFGHQITAHLGNREEKVTIKNYVDDKNVPVRHFGIILLWNDWKKFSHDLKNKNIEFIIEPYIRFKGEIGEQATLFIADPSKNFLEFKSFKNKKMIFSN